MNEQRLWVALSCGGEFLAALQVEAFLLGRGRLPRWAAALLLADEPTGNLDSQNSAAILALLKQFHTQFDQTVLLITHDLSIARQADRVLSIRDGRLAKDEVMRP